MNIGYAKDWFSYKSVKHFYKIVTCFTEQDLTILGVKELFSFLSELDFACIYKSYPSGEHFPKTQHRE